MKEANEAYKEALKYWKEGDEISAVMLFKYAARQGHREARKVCGFLYFHGIGVHKNRSMAWCYLKLL